MNKCEHNQTHYRGNGEPVHPVPADIAWPQRRFSVGMAVATLIVALLLGLGALEFFFRCLR